MKIFFYRLLFYLKSTRRKVKNSNNIYKLFLNKNILEVGGPSRFFKKNIPIYQLARNIDGVNFSNQTFWEGDLKNNSKYHYFKNKHGKQFISEASELNINTKYDILITSNCIEHLANPLEAVNNWIQHLNQNGLIFIVAPNKEKNFDWKRDYTTFKHLLDDYKKNVNESDITHIEESINLHDFNHKSNRLKKNELIQCFKNNFKYRMVHHHVFNLELLHNIADFFSLRVIVSGLLSKNFYILMSRK